MHEPSPNDCGCCADVHFGALLNQSARVIRRALDARISGVNPDLSGVRGMVLGDIVRANRNGRDVYQRDIEQWFNIAVPASPPFCRAWSRTVSSPAAPSRRTPA